MNENRLDDYLEHMQQAAKDACVFVEGLGKADFLEDKRTQQAVIMSLIIVGEAATKIMDSHIEFAQLNSQVPWRSMRGCATELRMAILKSILIWFGILFKRLCPNC